MQSPEKLWEENPLRKLAERSLETPGMYLMALRTHIHRGQEMLDDVLDTVADALPKPPKLQTPEES
jgi:hypothetical protein